MAKRQSLHILTIVGVIIMCLITFHYKGSSTIIELPQPKMDGPKFSRGTSVRQDWSDVTDLFVSQGKKYNSEDGVIYDCLSGGVHEVVGKQASTQRFSNIANGLDWSTEDDAKRQESFQNKFHPRHKDRMSPEHKVSGTGSTLQASQAPLSLLKSLIDRLKIHLNKNVITIVDIPCGDFFWMRELVGKRSDVMYTGIDIVPTLIERHRKNYGHWKHARFMHMDIVKSALNESYDIVFSRDMLQHLRTADALRALDHFSSSGSTLLVTTNLKSKHNLDIQHAQYRDLNLMLPPVNLVPPACQIPDKVANKLKYLAVWTLPLKQTK